MRLRRRNIKRRFVSGDEHVLIKDWAAQKKKLLYVSFNVSFDECANIIVGRKLK